MRRASTLVMFWREGEFVVENFVARTRAAITPALMQFVHEFAGPATLDDYRQRFAPLDTSGSLPELLIEHGVYELLGTEAADRSERLDQVWAWDLAARYFHFATRDTPFDSDIESQQQWLADLAAREPPPPPTRELDGEKVPLPRPADAKAPIGEVLAARRTVRSWSTVQLTLEQLSTVLWWTWGTQHYVEDSPIGPFQLKTSPSGGARHSIEVYVAALDVGGLDSGIYHYATRPHALSLVRSAPADELRRRVVDWFAGQPWGGEAHAVFMMTSLLGRSMWKYRHSHAYRVVLLDAGHLGQTFHLVCTAAGLGPWTSSGLHESTVESDLGLDGVSEIPVYGAAVGTTA